MLVEIKPISEVGTCGEKTLTSDTDDYCHIWRARDKQLTRFT
jgi:hypothetical protein